MLLPTGPIITRRGGSETLPSRRQPVFIINDLPAPEQPTRTAEEEKKILMERLTAVRRAQQELIDSDNADLLHSSLLEWGQLSCELRFHMHIPASEIAYVLENNR